MLTRSSGVRVSSWLSPSPALTLTGMSGEQLALSAPALMLTASPGVQVSERFAQYIDQMIQESGGACGGRAESLERLQQFLEPMLFLSGLEMASTFEHFYRCVLLLRLELTWGC